MMDDEEKVLVDELRMGNDAKHFLNHPMYLHVITEMHKGIFDAWCNCKVEDTDTQLKLKLLNKLFNDFKQIIETIAHTGSMADIQLTEKRKKFKLF